MFNKVNFALLTLIGLVFIAVGDRFLPGPVGQASTQARTTLNRSLMGLMPKLKSKPSRNQRTEDALKQTEQDAAR
ncbi:MAG: hypothetical protein F6K19_36170 [Cyanothece sp. SIO1E1]|nr:hypothetical protein [Cyanothece sp. SIO1E1]